MRKAITKNPNLDALIPREDFEVLATDSSGSTTTGRHDFDIKALEKGSFFYESLRKPDFQRETASWPPDKVAEFIRTFLDRDLVPAVILWKSKGNVFVIDGAHRLSALIAWVQSDYGDGLRSLPYFGNRISPEQKKIAVKTEALVNSTIGSYAEYVAAAQHPDPTKPLLAERARNLSSHTIKVQWVEGDFRKAEYSFFKINQSATIIDATELSIIKARRKPNALAARALMRAGTGHKYWSDFPETVQRDIEQIASDVHGILFEPELAEPIRTLDLPVAGTGYSAEMVKLLFDFVNFVNGVRPDMWQEDTPGSKKKRAGPRLENDSDGSATIGYLKTAKRIASRISGLHPSSLGLHPAVYFYGATGGYQSSSFLAAAALIIEFEKTNGFFRFTQHRYAFEEFLVKYRYFVNQIVNGIGSGTKSLEPVYEMYTIILDGVAAGLTDDGILAALAADRRLMKYVRVLGDAGKGDRTFTRAIKNAIFLQSALETAPRCALCHARIHKNSVTFDHNIRREDGGSGMADNGQIAHPYCNTGYKEALHAKELKAGE